MKTLLKDDELRNISGGASETIQIVTHQSGHVLFTGSKEDFLASPQATGWEHAINAGAMDAFLVK